LEVGDGLELRLRRSALILPAGGVLVEAAARRVPLFQLCRQFRIEGEEILAVFALHPFGATSEVPIGVRAPVQLAAGSGVNFRTVGEIDGRWSEPVPGRSDGTGVATDPSAGIAELTWLVISR
jgi:hypothetical protein